MDKLRLKVAVVSIFLRELNSFLLNLLLGNLLRGDNLLDEASYPKTQKVYELFQPLALQL